MIFLFISYLSHSLSFEDRGCEREIIILYSRAIPPYRDYMLILHTMKKKKLASTSAIYFHFFLYVVYTQQLKPGKKKSNFFSLFLHFGKTEKRGGGGAPLIECPNSMCEHVRACVMSRSSALCRHFVVGR